MATRGATLLAEFAGRAAIAYTNNNATAGVNKGCIELLDVRAVLAELQTDPGASSPKARADTSSRGAPLSSGC